MLSSFFKKIIVFIIYWLCWVSVEYVGSLILAGCGSPSCKYVGSSCSSEPGPHTRSTESRPQTTSKVPGLCFHACFLMGCFPDTKRMFMFGWSVDREPCCTLLLDIGRASFFFLLSVSSINRVLTLLQDRQSSVDGPLVSIHLCRDCSNCLLMKK